MKNDLNICVVGSGQLFLLFVFQMDSVIERNMRVECVCVFYSCVLLYNVSLMESLVIFLIFVPHQHLFYYSTCSE